MLHHIKKMFGVGEVRVSKDGSRALLDGRGTSSPMAEFRIRDRKHLLSHVIPLFDQNPLLTSKHYHYDLFKKALMISMNSELTTTQKTSLLSELYALSAKKSNALADQRSAAVDYISPA